MTTRHRINELERLLERARPLINELAYRQQVEARPCHAADGLLGEINAALGPA